MIRRFEMSGQRFEFDEDPACFTFDDLMVVEDVFGMSLDEFLARISQVGAAADRGMALRTVGAMAFLSYRRAGGGLEWLAFSKTIAPATLRVIPDEPAAAPVPVVSPTAAALDAAEPAEPNVFDLPQPTG